MPELTIFVPTRDLERDAALGIRSLSPAHQRGVEAGDHEVIPVEVGRGKSLPAVVNAAVAATSTPFVGLMADAARLATPGVVAAALRCLRGLGRTVAVTDAVDPGGDLVFLPRALLDEAGGYDEHSFAARAGRLAGVASVALLGEGTLGPPRASTEMARRYVELLKQSLLNIHAMEAEAAYFLSRDALRAADVPFDETITYDIRGRAAMLVARAQMAREAGALLDWRAENVGFGYTMVGRRRLENVEACVASVIDDGVPGDLVECGAWRGGTTIFMRALLALHGVADRTVWVADSFDGLPPPDAEHDTLDLTKDVRPELAVSLKRVKANFERFGLLDDQVRFLKGWFKDTLPAAPIERIAVLRLDGDLYESTMTSLEALYDKLSPGGYVIVDDYKLIDVCKLAVDEFRASRGIEDPIEEIDWTGVYWRRGPVG